MGASGVRHHYFELAAQRAFVERIASAQLPSKIR